MLIVMARLGIPGQYDSELFHNTVAKIATAAEKASKDGRKVFVGLGGLEPRPDILEALAKRHSLIRYFKPFQSDLYTIADGFAQICYGRPGYRFAYGRYEQAERSHGSHIGIFVAVEDDGDREMMDEVVVAMGVNMEIQDDRPGIDPCTSTDLLISHHNATTKSVFDATSSTTTIQPMTRRVCDT